MNESDEESNWNSNIKRFVRSKKRTRILEISDSSTEADDVYKFRLHYENYNQKIKKVKRKKEEIFYTCSKILFMLRNSKIEMAIARNYATIVLQRMTEYLFLVYFGKWEILTKKILSCFYPICVGQ